MNKRYGASLALIVGLLTGCGGDPQNSATVNESPSSQSSSTRPPVDASVPAAARANTAEGAEAFALYYFDLYNQLVTRQPDAAKLEALQAPDCGSCTEIVGTVSYYQDGNFIASGPPATVTSRGVHDPGDGTMIVAITSSTNAVQVLDSSGATVRTVKEIAPYAAQVWLTREGESWKVLRMPREES